MFHHTIPLAYDYHKEYRGAIVSVKQEFTETSVPTYATMIKDAARHLSHFMTLADTIIKHESLLYLYLLPNYWLILSRDNQVASISKICELIYQCLFHLTCSPKEFDGSTVMLTDSV